MNKRKHPTNRYERLVINEKKSNKKTGASKDGRRLKDRINDEETRNELQWAKAKIGKVQDVLE